MNEQEVKNTNEENLFQYLTRKDKSRFDNRTITNWYIAREYVREKLEDVTIGPETRQHLHVVVHDDDRDDMMLCVLRQVCLSAHYSNFIEEIDGEGGDPVCKCKNRSVVTFVTDRKEVEKELAKEDYLCNLMKYCEYSLFGKKENEESFLDIELHIVSTSPENHTNDEIVREMKRDELLGFESKPGIGKINTRIAVYADKMYQLGAEIGNLSAEDIHNAHRYQRALDKFQYVKMDEEWKRMSDQWQMTTDDEHWSENLSNVKEGLSNIFCADCFESRKRGIEQLYEDEKQRQETGEKSEPLKMNLWEEYNEALSRSEHARWMAEKFIMGYRSLNNNEILKYESLFGKDRDDYLLKLKRNAGDPAHIDLCSYHDLRRIDPDDLKYDSFLVLCIPEILKTNDEA